MFQIVNVVERAKKFPDKFALPNAGELDRLGVGGMCKIILEGNFPSAYQGPSGERLWINIIEATREGYLGAINNDPVLVNMKYGDKVAFQRENICEVWHGD